MIEAKIIADSLCATSNKRLITFELQYPRFIHGEVMTHRVFSRNAMSSRAIPVAKMIEQVRNNPAMPVWWGKNQAGMQAKEELTGEELEAAKTAWMAAADVVSQSAELMMRIGLHKQVANRVLEPFQWMRTLVTATEWDNFYELRDHPDAQPEFQALARAMRKAQNESSPEMRNYVSGKYGMPEWTTSQNSWHLPYVSNDERQQYPVWTLCKLSAARCARVSYLTHGGEKPRYEDDLNLYDRLVGSKPIHASPTEHQAYAIDVTQMGATGLESNFRGWAQFRKFVECGLVE